MPEYDSGTQTKLDALRTRYLAGETIDVFELLEIQWPSPDDTIYYAPLQTDEISPELTAVASPIECRLVPENQPNWFLPIKLGSLIGDEEVGLLFWDGDDAMTDLMIAHGEGVRAVVHYWFPQETLLLRHWQGHLRNEEEAEFAFLKLKAVQGFRSNETTVPGGAHYGQCGAIFGGLLETQARIDEGMCPHNLHIGGSIGIVNPSTGLPWTFCDRRDLSSCTARGVHPLYHYSHRTIQTIVVNNQTHGGRLYSTGQGNETNLKEPVRVVMGTRRVHGCPIVAYRRDLNNNHPDQGWFFGVYEVSEGPLGAIWNSVINVGGESQAANPQHYGYRLGNKGQTPVSTVTTHGYSGRALIAYNFGWVDPSEIQPSDASADVTTDGISNIRILSNQAAGAGLVASFYYDLDFTSLVGQRVDAAINFPQNGSSPFGGINPNLGFSVKWQGTIIFDFSETYTFTLFHDDHGTLIIDGDTVIDETIFGTHTGTFAATAGVEYDIELRIIQNPAEGYNPWGAVLQWQSTSQALQIVTDFTHEEAVETYAVGTSTNRVWQIGRIQCDKNWGYGEDYEKLNSNAWIEAAEWADDFITFTDPFGTAWPHVRAQSNVELVGRKVQQQIDDMCIAGRLSRPFLFDGKIHIVPLRALTEDELDACPVFTDEGTSKNVVVQEKDGVEISTLRVGRTSDLDLPNRIECTFDSSANDFLETPLAPVEDIDAQLRAGRIVGDHARKTNVKKYSLLGVTVEAQALKIAWSILDLGPLDEGGLQNNCRIKFQIWFADVLELHPYKVIKYVNAKLQAKWGFTYFRIVDGGIEKKDDLTYEITAQAYNVDYMNDFETTSAPIDPPTDELTTGLKGCVLTFGAISLADGMLSIEIPEC
jgi:hypothetical protein